MMARVLSGALLSLQKGTHPITGDMTNLEGVLLRHINQLWKDRPRVQFHVESEAVCPPPRRSDRGGHQRPV